MALARAGGRIRGAPACWMLSSANGGSWLAYGTRHLMPEAANGSGLTALHNQRGQILLIVWVVRTCDCG